MLTEESSSSQRSKRALMASSDSSGKCLKNRDMNCAARRFVCVVPLTPFNIVLYVS